MKKNYEKTLAIKTDNSGSGVKKSSQYYQYEATPYPTIETLFNSYTINKTDRFIDFGSGKGRMMFFVHYHFNAAVVGVEMNEDLHKETVANKRTYIEQTGNHAASIEPICDLAENYQIKALDNIFYFFNPFSIQIFKKVIKNILTSVKNNPRPIELILYYPDKKYIKFLQKKTPFVLDKTVEITGLYTINKRECFLLYHLN